MSDAGDGASSVDASLHRLSMQDTQSVHSESLYDAEECAPHHKVERRAEAAAAVAANARRMSLLNEELAVRFQGAGWLHTAASYGWAEILGA